MTINGYLTMLSMLVFTSLTLTAQAPDRMRAGQWDWDDHHRRQDVPDVELRVAE
jgi:hypothetical protein